MEGGTPDINMEELKLEQDVKSLDRRLSRVGNAASAPQIRTAAMGGQPAMPPISFNDLQKRFSGALGLEAGTPGRHTGITSASTTPGRTGEISSLGTPGRASITTPGRHGLGSSRSTTTIGTAGGLRGSLSRSPGITTESLMQRLSMGTASSALKSMAMVAKAKGSAQRRSRSAPTGGSSPQGKASPKKAPMTPNAKLAKATALAKSPAKASPGMGLAAAVSVVSSLKVPFGGGKVTKKDKAKADAEAEAQRMKDEAEAEAERKRAEDNHLGPTSPEMVTIRSISDTFINTLAKTEITLQRMLFDLACEVHESQPWGWTPIPEQMPQPPGSMQHQFRDLRPAPELWEKAMKPHPAEEQLAPPRRLSQSSSTPQLRSSIRASAGALDPAQIAAAAAAAGASPELGGGETARARRRSSTPDPQKQRSRSASIQKRR